MGYDSDCFLKSHKVVKNNQTHVVFEKMKFNIKINKAHINLDNLFNGDPVLGMFEFLSHTIFIRLFYLKKLFIANMQLKSSQLIFFF